MSNLSWLNPTPHAIAVYASHPPSPVAAQHSLPSGRYSLLGPDFHRPDRTSLRLAHSFDHFIGTKQKRLRDIEANRIRCFQIDDQLECQRCLHREVIWRRTLEDLVSITGRLSKNDAQPPLLLRRSPSIKPVEQSPCLLKIRSVEALSEPVINWREQSSGLVASALSLQHSTETHRRS